MPRTNLLVRSAGRRGCALVPVWLASLAAACTPVGEVNHSREQRTQTSAAIAADAGVEDTRRAHSANPAAEASGGDLDVELDAGTSGG